MPRLLAFINLRIHLVVILWCLSLATGFSALSIIRHTHYQSGGFDLGIFDQAVWQYANFQNPYNTVKERFILGDHLTLTLPLLAPLYWIWDDVRMLLVFQALAMSVSVYGVYLIAVKRGYGSGLSALLAFTYSMFYGIQYGIFFDFHPVLIGVSLLPFLALAFETKRWKIFLILLALTLLTQENMGLAVSCLGYFYLFSKETRGKAILLMLFGIAWSATAALIIRSISPVGYDYTPQIPHNPIEIIARFFDSPEKRQVMLWTFGSFGFLPLLSPAGLLAICTDLAQYFVTGEAFRRMWSPYMHHRAILSVFGILAVMDTVWIFRKFRIHPVYIGIVLAVLAIFLQYSWHLPLNKLTKSEFTRVEPWMDNISSLISVIPPGVSVAAQQNIVPHLTHRKEIYVLYPKIRDFSDQPCGQTSCFWFDFGDHPQYMVVDTRRGQWLTQTLESDENVQEAIQTMEITHTIQLVKSVGDARLYRIVRQ